MHIDTLMNTRRGKITNSEDVEIPMKMDASRTHKWRLVVYYKNIKENTINDKYPIPNITDTIDKLDRSSPNF